MEYCVCVCVRLCVCVCQSVYALSVSDVNMVYVKNYLCLMVYSSCQYREEDIILLHKCMKARKWIYCLNMNTFKYTSLAHWIINCFSFDFNVARVLHNSISPWNQLLFKYKPCIYQHKIKYRFARQYVTRLELCGR